MSVTESTTIMNGELRIDNVNGVATFTDGWGAVILRVTHLREPVPANTKIDLVALDALTSYTPVQPKEMPDAPYA